MHHMTTERIFADIDCYSTQGEDRLGYMQYGNKSILSCCMCRQCYDENDDRWLSPHECAKFNKKNNWVCSNDCAAEWREQNWEEIDEFDEAKHALADKQLQLKIKFLEEQGNIFDRYMRNLA